MPAPAGPPAAVEPTVSIGRYVLYEEIARGGMGVVHRGHDERLNRELAVKVLHPHFCDSDGVVRRFTDEAQIGGQLQHPGIVPVHDIDVLPDGRPFFAMKLVKGHTLADLLAQRDNVLHKLPHFLKIFEQVCQTVAFAHARHVLHRDLKPANIMVGAFGEVQVMDWGLAKVLGRPAPSAPAPAAPSAITEIHTGSGDASGGQTQAGAVMGTYAYMPPEQARGQVDLLDERCDVFGLGAILCEILTGRPPYWADGQEELRVLALVADQQDMEGRLSVCGADAELLGLVRACLAARPEDRPRDAGAVAAAMSGYLAGVQDRLRQAEVERTAAQVKAAEERKRRRVSLALAATLLLVILAGGAASTFVRRQQQAQHDQTALLVNQALGQATALRDQAQDVPLSEPAQRERAASLWRDALAAAARAEQALDSGSAERATHERVTTALTELRAQEAVAARDLRLLQRLDEARDLATDIQESDYVRPRRVDDFVFGLAAAPAYAAAFREYGIDVESLPSAAAAERIRGSAIRLPLAIALDDWYFLDPKAAGGRLLEVARAADPEPLRDRLRVAIGRSDPRALKELAADKDAERLPPPLLVLLADMLRKEELRREAIELLHRAQRLHPGDFWVNDVLGLHLNVADPPDYEAAGRCFRAAIALRPNSPVPWDNLGSVLAIQGRLEEAAAAFRQSIRINPATTMSYERLSACLREQNATAEARAVLAEGLRLRPGSAMLRTALGDLELSEQKRDEAAARYRQVLASHPDWLLARTGLARTLAESGQKTAALKEIERALTTHPLSSQVYFMRGFILYQDSDTTGAEAAFRKAVQLRPGDPYNWSWLGAALGAAGRLDEALSAYQKAAGMAPANATLRTQLAGALVRKNRLEEAAAVAREAIVLNPALVDAHYQLGLVLTDLGRLEPAAAALRAALRLRSQDAWMHSALGDCLSKAKDGKGARAAYDEASRLLPGEYTFHNKRGNVAFTEGRYAEAVPHYRAAAGLQPTNAVVQTNLGNALRLRGDLPGAVRTLKEAARLDKGAGDTRIKLTLALWQAQQFQEAVVVGREAVALRPDDASAHNALGLALDAKGSAEAAIAAYRQATQLDSSESVYVANLGRILYRQERYAEAADAFRTVIRLQPASAAHHESLGDSLQGLQRHAEAATAYRKSIELAPTAVRSHLQLARVLMLQHDFRWAEAAARKAIELAPQGSDGYNLLGHINHNQGKYTQAASWYRQALARQPGSAQLYVNLGNSLKRQGQPADAEAAYRSAVHHNGRHEEALFQLGICLLESGKPAEAEAELRRALEVSPQSSVLHARLSVALLAQDKVTSAVAAARKAVELKPRSAREHFRLGDALLAQGGFAEAVAVFQQAQRLRTPADNAHDPLPWNERVREAVRCLELDAAVEAARQGKVKVLDGDELIALARFCQGRKRQPALAAQFFADAFAVSTKLADDLHAGHRLAAACSAVTAADAGRWRKQALDWLRADLTAWTRQSESGTPQERAAARTQLLRWRQLRDLAGVRDAAALARLPEAERAAWTKLWDDVTALLERSSPNRDNPRQGTRSK